jgi:RecB family endonuclease NucS
LTTEEVESVGGSEFAYEKDLQGFLAKNLGLLEPGLQLYQDEGITGIEFPAGGRFVDILAVDINGNLVVIELKVSRGYDRVIGQLLRYMAWIEKKQADEGQSVRGVIIGREITEDLRLACSCVPNVALYEYELSVALRKVLASETRS